MNIETFASPTQPSASLNLDVLLASVCLQDTDSARAPVVRVSRMEAILADVFEKGLSAMAVQTLRQAA